ncbi:hypothetical protein DFH29DRAFT_884043 [Suillus ampliporus]|nr:hypothetical protein DFH29DRAFT_884043 [Suillus ampliporus]
MSLPCPILLCFLMLFLMAQQVLIAILWLDADNVLHKYVNSSVCEEEGFAVRHVWVAFGDWQVTVWLPVPMSTSFLVVNACHDLESDSKQDHKEDLRHEGRWY